MITVVVVLIMKVEAAATEVVITEVARILTIMI